MKTWIFPLLHVLATERLLAHQPRAHNSPDLRQEEEGVVMLAPSQSVVPRAREMRSPHTAFAVDAPLVAARAISFHMQFLPATGMHACCASRFSSQLVASCVRVFSLA
eukprot:m.26144 g.26144  ORF g.26144 m.26144 type:complete len:108 (+) comp8799_c0_seq1:1848-2171(+)